MKVLLAEDSKSSQLVIKSYIEEANYQVVIANNGQEAVELFLSEKPDLILMDVSMPIMDGVSAAQEIRKQSVDSWIPIIFLSGLASPKDIVRGIDAGGDDYLTKPIDSIVLNSKLRAMQRISDMQAKLEQAHQDLTAKQNILEQEELIARHVFESITSVNKSDSSEINLWCKPMESFSGDLVLSTILPSGKLRVLLCDFTGHGLPAALGAIPASSIFTALAHKDLPLEILIAEVNEKLKTLLPTNIFSCACGIDIDSSRTKFRVWNAGLPDMLIIDAKGNVKQRFPSTHLPLGIVSYDKEELHCVTGYLDDGDLIYMYSDGIVEAENSTGEMLGEEAFENLLMTSTSKSGRISDIKSRTLSFMGSAPSTDDISLVEIQVKT